MNRWFENGFRFFTVKNKIDNLRYFYNFNQDLKLLTCEYDNLYNIYRMIVENNKNGKYEVKFKVDDDGNIRNFVFSGCGINSDPSKIYISFRI